MVIYGYIWLYKNGDDWGMVQMALFYLHYLEKARIRLGHAYFVTHT